MEQLENLCDLFLRGELDYKEFHRNAEAQIHRFTTTQLKTMAVAISIYMKVKRGAAIPYAKET